MPSVRLLNDKTFAVDPGSTILEAAQRSGLTLEHSCRTGRCGTCKARLVKGQVGSLRAAVALTSQELDAGWILTCTATALDDVSLDIDDIGLPPGLEARTFPCRVDSIEHPAPDVAVVRLRLPPSANFHWLAGQYLDLIGPGGLRRSYSIANDPAGSAGKIELHIRRVDGGALSEYWFHKARSNDLLRLHGPLGTFFLRDVAGLHVVMLATGTGLAPFIAMLSDLFARPQAQQPRSVTLFWGNRHEADVYWSPEAVHGSRLTFIPVLSRPDATWTGTRGHVQDALLARPFEWTVTTVYACGLPAMIDDARSALIAAGLSPRRFFSDAFVSSS